MPRPEILPRFFVRVLTDEGAVQALWPDGTPAYRVGLVPERSLAAALRDAEALAELDPDAVLVVMNDAGEELHRVESFASVPF